MPWALSRTIRARRQATTQDVRNIVNKTPSGTGRHQKALLPSDAPIPQSTIPALSHSC